MNYLKTVCTYLLTTVSLFALHQEKVKAQVTGGVNGATATGAVSVFNSDTGYTQTVSGQISLPAGEFLGPAVITPTVTLTNSSDPLIAPVTNLTINPGGINFFVTPTDFNQQISQILSGLSAADDLSEIVSLLRANSDLLSSGSTSQATATGSSLLLGPDGSIQSVSGEVALPTGLYYEGAVYNDPATPQLEGNANDSNCGFGVGCLAIVPIFDPNGIPQQPSLPRIQSLIIDPGPVNLVFPSYDLNSAAASVLSGADPSTQLSDIVSIIRSASGDNGPFSTRTQARAVGMVMISTPNGSTQSVSGEITLPAGLYFDGSFNPANTDCPASSCLTVSPDIQWNDVTPTGAQANSAFIRDLNINPGDVQPGDPSAPTGLFLPSSFDFNSAVADILYRYIDQDQSTDDQLANIVSVIRGGAGISGLTPSNRPTARAFGSATISVPNGSTQSVTAELTLPNSKYFDLGSTANPGNFVFTVTPNFQNVPADATDDPNLLTINQLVIDPGIAVDAADVRGWDFEAAAADALNKADSLEERISIIRAAGGAGLD